MKLARSSALGVLGILGVLGVGGLAAAQDGLIVDPWAHAVSALLPSKAAAAPAPAKRSVGVASFPVEHAAAPAVVPVGPPLREGAVDPKAPLAVGSAGPLDATVDPWVEPSPAAAATPHRVTPTQWAWQIREIVDPWAKGPVAVAATDPAIVDPWGPRPQGRY
jgi:hypothetical protein